jgi:hypothetical protein
MDVVCILSLGSHDEGSTRKLGTGPSFKVKMSQAFRFSLRKFFGKLFPLEFFWPISELDPGEFSP